MRRDTSVDSCNSLVDPVTPEKNNVEHLSPNTVVSKPNNRFYVMDWLEQIDEMAMEQAKSVIKANNLSTPVKPPKRNYQDAPARDGVESTSKNNTPPRHPDRAVQRNIAANLSPYKRRSEAIGNGWNAKGLQKAKIGEWEDALLCWENALEIRLQILGENHSDVSNTLNNMGIALGRLGRCDEAMTLLNRALKIRTRVHGANVHHLEIAATLHNIGNVFQQMKDYDGALRCFEETKRAQVAILSEHDVLVARTENAIGHLNYECNRFEEALDAYESARDIFQLAGFSEGNAEFDSVLLDVEDAKEAIANITNC